MAQVFYAASNFSLVEPEGELEEKFFTEEVAEDAIWFGHRLVVENRYLAGLLDGVAFYLAPVMVEEVTEYLASH